MQGSTVAARNAQNVLLTAPPPIVPSGGARFVVPGLSSLTKFHSEDPFRRRLTFSNYPDALGKIAPNDTFELSA